MSWLCTKHDDVDCEWAVAMAMPASAHGYIICRGEGCAGICHKILQPMQDPLARPVRF